MYGQCWTPVVVGGHAWAVLDTSSRWRTYYMDIARRWRTYMDIAGRWRTYMDIAGHKWSLADKYGLVWTITDTMMVRGQQQWTSSMDRPFWGRPKKSQMVCITLLLLIVYITLLIRSIFSPYTTKWCPVTLSI